MNRLPTGFWRDASAGLHLFRSPDHACNYLPDREASTLFVDPLDSMDPVLFEYLLLQGFRRSGGHVYRPYCQRCDACLPVRVPVAHFSRGGGFRRIWRRNQDLTVEVQPASFTVESFDLYRRYLAARHGDGPMADPLPEDFVSFLIAPWSDTWFVAFRDSGGRLLMVAVVDRQPRALSAVYTFFEPEEKRRSLGSFAILWEIAEAARLGLSWVFLGYWIAQCRSMRYKARFQPLEVRRGGVWTPLSEEEAIVNLEEANSGLQSEASD
ncbi:MAG: arginyltransferase [Magnetococcales bacterium]|nr:arginyltransferase [Magnetococcales bacterium]